MTSVFDPPPDHFNMAAYCLAASAAAFPDKPALVVVDDPVRGSPSEIWSFSALEDAVLRTAHGLRTLGLEPGARMLIRLDNTSDYAILFFGAIAAGLVALPASSQLTAEEVGFLLHDSGASAIAVTAALPVGAIPPGVRFIELAEVKRLAFHHERATYASTRSDDPAFLIYTSGTTASPKGVLHAHRAAWGRRPMYQGWYGIGSGDRMFHAGAFNWTYTLGTGLTDPWANGATAIIYTGEKDPALWPRLIRETQATIFAAVPGLVRQMLKYARPDRNALGVLRHALIAGESPPAGLFEEWDAMTTLPLYEALGMSEISTYISTGPNVPRRPDRLGKAQHGRRIAVLAPESGRDPLAPGSEGLLAVHRSDPGLMLGYWNRPQEEAEVYRGDWFVGGDLAFIDEDGYVAHLGRANDIMKALGYRVSPLEVEAILARHPGVSEVACAEIRVREDVSVIGAFVVPKGPDLPSSESIIEHAREHLAAYKCPRQVLYVASLPRTANGKVRRSALTSMPTLPTGQIFP